MSTTWEFTSGVRGRHLGGALTNEQCVAIGGELDDWRAQHDTEPESRAWHTAQLADGRICGSWGDTSLAAQLGIEVWWGAAVHWIARDPDCVIHNRYLTEVSSDATRSDAARTFVLTDQPAMCPRREHEPIPEPTLFDL